MAKRFTDTDKWKKPFIRGLEAPYKLLWFYILDDCDYAGMWQVDFEIAKIRIGDSNLNMETAISVFGDKIQIIEDGEKWFIQDFIEFQYGELNPQNRAHNSVLILLNRYKIKGLRSSLNGAKEKEQDKEKDKEKDKERKLSKKIYFKESDYFIKENFKEALPDWDKEKLVYYYDSVLAWSNEGNKKIDWIATVKNWAKRDEKEGKIKFANPNSPRVLKNAGMEGIL